MHDTTDEMRDELAGFLGWRRAIVGSDEGTHYYQWQRKTDCGWIAGPNAGQDHPCASLDSLAAIWESELKGWEWTRDVGKGFEWTAHTLDPGGWWVVRARVHDTGDELHDRTALTLAAWKAKKGST